MTILQDMDKVFVANRPLPKSAEWLIGGNVWHAFVADLIITYAQNGFDFDLHHFPDTLFGAPLRRVPRMNGWGLAERLDCDPAARHEIGRKGVDAHGKTMAE